MIGKGSKKPISRLLTVDEMILKRWDTPSLYFPLANIFPLLFASDYLVLIRKTRNLFTIIQTAFQYNFTNMIDETKIKNSPSTAISKMWSAFFKHLKLPEIH